MYALFRNVLPVFIGQCICAAAVMGVFLMTGNFDGTVLWGSIAGTLISLGNFVLLTFFADRAADRASRGDVAGGQTLLRLSYLCRMAGLAVSLALFAGSGYVHALALALPLLFTRPVLTILESFSRKGGN